MGYDSYGLHIWIGAVAANLVYMRIQPAVARREAMRDPLVREGLRAAALADQRGDGARASAERRGARLVAASIANRVERRRTGNKQFAVAGGQYAY